MISFFTDDLRTFAIVTESTLLFEDITKLEWLFSGATYTDKKELEGIFLGPRSNMITPYSTNAVEIVETMGIHTIKRIEVFHAVEDTHSEYDHLLYQMYEGLSQSMFSLEGHETGNSVVDDIANYNRVYGLSLNDQEVNYLNELSKRFGRSLTEAEVFGYSQINSEHCRHKIFNGRFIIDDHEKEMTLFEMIKSTSKSHPNYIVSAYKDNVAFISGPRITQFAPENPTKPSKYSAKQRDSVISLKAETHNFPTTVEPFNGAATGSGGEIRDRMAGGQGSLPLAGTAVYMTSYPRFSSELWKSDITPRHWLYQSPLNILRKASDGASDFGNKFGQPLISGSCLTFEMSVGEDICAYDKVIMLAGGVGYGILEQSKKKDIHAGDSIIVLGGDNYRIGLGGASVSSSDTGAFGSKIELNAVQRSNPEMQKRISNAIRALVEKDENPIQSIHDHGAGGHLNCLTELVETEGGEIYLDKLPIGDPTLNYRELLTNESQERMGLVMEPQALEELKSICNRERAPFFEVGRVRDDHKFIATVTDGSDTVIDLKMDDLFGNSPKMVLKDKTIPSSVMPFQNLEQLDIYESLIKVMSLEAVACKDWLTNKVDRCVGGKVAKQQCVGSLQLPLSDCGVTAIDFGSPQGIAVSMGHAPGISLISAAAASRISILEALTNIIFVPLTHGLKGISLSANWMWPCGNAGEESRLYEAVQACAHFAMSLGINIPTGKDSLSMTQKYNDVQIKAPGTVIITAVGECSDITRLIDPIFQVNEGSIYLLNMTAAPPMLGGSSLSQVLNRLGDSAPDAHEPETVVSIFNAIQFILKNRMIVAGHDVGSGGLLVSLLEMAFSSHGTGAEIDLSGYSTLADAAVLFSENPALIFQLRKNSEEEALVALLEYGVKPIKIGHVTENEEVYIKTYNNNFKFDVSKYRDIWYHKSYLLDAEQTANGLAKTRFENYKLQPLSYQFPSWFNGKLPKLPSDRKIKAGVLREKGSNSERELANALFLAGFEVIDIHTTDILEGRTDLSEIHFLGAVGGFSHSDVMGSAKGWAAAFKYNPKAGEALRKFFDRKDTLSIGICNGCQLFMELDMIYPEFPHHPKMHHNDSGKHESAFTSVEIAENNSIMLQRYGGAKLGVWISHGEGKFVFDGEESNYNIIGKYGYADYPSNPNGSEFNAALVCSNDGRHLATMPHIERSIFTWNWPFYPEDKNHTVSPWLEAFVDAREWIEQQLFV
ncbi:MAG: phosphoribosylformylglycinamidine synthase [Lewinellaceae bacterium]|nr:phosphoribosylformylglycinamidine synthase [Lewinellaceae bacterium]